MDIKGKVFIVTGAASGLGEGTARALAAKGGIVVIADMQADKGEAVAKDIGGAFVKCDVSNEADGQALVAKAVSLGKLMGLVNCAGIAPAEKTVGKNGAHALASFSKTITINLIGSFNMIRLASEAMCHNEPEACSLACPKKCKTPSPQACLSLHASAHHKTTPSWPCTSLKMIYSTAK